MNSQAARRPETPLEQVRNVSEANCRSHARALSFRNGIGIPQSVSWLPCGWGGEREQEPLWRALLSTRGAMRLSHGIRDRSSKTSARAARHATERMGMLGGLQEFFETASGSWDRNRFTPREVYLAHTTLGGPKVILRSRPAACLRELGIAPSDLHISFTHDGGAHLAIVACGTGLRGLGIDAVHLPRLLRPGKDNGYLHRLAMSFMSPEEYSILNANSATDSLGELAVRVAAHFSLMEAGSKALGTGLRIGGGMGKPESLPKRAIEVLQIDPVVNFCLTSEAADRAATLQASHLAGYWSSDDEYLVSVAVLW